MRCDIRKKIMGYTWTIGLCILLSVFIVETGTNYNSQRSEGAVTITNTPPATTFKYLHPAKEADVHARGIITGETVRQHDARVTPVPKVQEDIDPYVDRNLKVNLSVNGDRQALRAKRYGVASNPKEFRVTFAKGGRSHDSAVMMDVITATIQRMPHLRGTINFKLQILETMAVESSLGKTLDTGGGDLGICQIRLETAKDVLMFLKERHPDAYIAVQSLKDPNMDLRENLVRNIPYSIALCGSIYWWRIPDILHKGDTQTDRGLLWKVCYNTHLGYGRIKDYCDRSSEMIDYGRLFMSVASK